MAVIILPLLFIGVFKEADPKVDENVTNSTFQEAEEFEVGDFCYLTDNCFGFVDYDDLRNVMDIIKADDKRGMQEMIVNKKATTLASGKRVKIIKIRTDFIQVIDVDASELQVWVPSSMLTHEDVYGLYEK